MYVALSRVPWLAPLAAWDTGGSGARGLHFAPPGTWEVGPAERGDADPLRFRHGLAWTDPLETYAVERRRGWVEGAGTPLRLADRRHTERHAEQAVMVRKQPHGPGVLSVRGAHPSGDGPEEWWPTPTYALDGEPLEGVQWADWSPIGRLLAATTDGRLQLREAGDVVWEHDLAPLAPDPSPDPELAQHW
jgi:hypothetical protein